MAWLRTEEEVDEMIEEMLQKGNGKYITQSVLFKKDSEKQMELLKKVLMSSTSFGAFVKQVIAEKFDGVELNNISNNQNHTDNTPPIQKKDVGNFF